MTPGAVRGSRPVLIVKTGSTFPPLSARRGDFDAWIAAGLALPPTLPIEVAAIFESQPLPAPGDLAGVVVTGSPAMKKKGGREGRMRM